LILLTTNFTRRIETNAILKFLFQDFSQLNTASGSVGLLPPVFYKQGVLTGWFVLNAPNSPRSSGTKKIKYPLDALILEIIDKRVYFT